MFRTHQLTLAGLVGALAGATSLTGVASAAAWTKLATVNPLTGPSDWNTFNAVTRPATNRPARASSARSRRTVPTAGSGRPATSRRRIVKTLIEAHP
jgi:hypothetical protein